MCFLFELNDSPMEIEQTILKDVIKRYNNMYITKIIVECITYDELKMSQNNYSEYIPIGGLSFTQLFFQKYFNMEMFSIEVPKILQTEEFLHREYKIINRDQVPKQGYFFVKDATRIKGMTYLGEISYIHDSLNKNQYILSQALNIISEWRIYVINGKIENICCYDGKPTVFPNVRLINKAIAKYNFNGSPKSYTLDVCVDTNNNTSVIEVHTFLCTGLYTPLWGMNLLDAYKDGKDYVLKSFISNQ